MAATALKNQVLTKVLMILVMGLWQINRVQVGQWLSTRCFVFIRFQKRFSNKVTWSIEKYPPNKLRIGIAEITIQFFTRFLNLKTRTRQVIPFWIQAVGFLQLPRSSLRQAGKHSWGEARHRGVNSFISRLSRGLTRGNARVNELGITPCSSCNVICHLRVKSLQGSTNAAQNIFDSIGGSSKRSW